jgi:hypothetical protein
MPEFTLFGDTSGTLTGIGESQKLKGKKDFKNFLHGDALEIAGNGVGGNDKVKGGSFSTLEDRDNLLYGDAFTMIDSARGGNDKIKGGSNGFNVLHGDASTMTGSAVGGNDRLVGGRDSINTLFGDAFSMDGTTRGGNDTLIGGTGIFNFGGESGPVDNLLHGDASTMQGNAVAGNDLLIGGNGVRNTLYGDAFTVQLDAGAAACGDDRLIGGDGADNFMYGDAYNLIGSIGGNDRLEGGKDGAFSIMYGDAFFVSGTDEQPAICGDDILVSAKFGNDTMYGDYEFADGTVITGRDIFVFGIDNGIDDVMDFRQGEDLIDLTELATNFASLNIILISGTDSLIDFGNNNTIFVVGITTLAETDFIF